MELPRSLNLTNGPCNSTHMVVRNLSTRAIERTDHWEWELNSIKTPCESRFIQVTVFSIWGQKMIISSCLAFATTVKEAGFHASVFTVIECVRVMLGHHNLQAKRAL